MTSTATEEMAKMTMKTTVPAPPKLAKGKKGVPRKVVTNSFMATLKPNTPFYLHDCRVYAVYTRNNEEKLKEVTKQTRDDYLEQDRKSACVQAYIAMKATGAIKGDTFYDRAALLISLQEISQCKGGEFTTVLTSKNAPKLFALDSIKESKEVRVVIKRAADSYQVTSNDISSTNEATRKALLSVVNLATSQNLFEKNDEFIVYGNGNAYLLNPEGHGFKNFEVGTADKYGGVGLTKGARFVEGPTGQPATAITVDVKKTAFHKDLELVSDKMRDNGCEGNPAEASQLLTGLKAIVYYSGLDEKEQKSRVITIGFVGHERVKDVSFIDSKGKKMNLPQYVQSKYKTRIANVNTFVVIEKYEGHKFAPECLRIAPNQRVKTENQQPTVIEKLIRESASLPAKRQSETSVLARCLDAGANNSAQVKRGVTVDTNKAIEIQGRVLDAVKLGTGVPTPLSVNGPWRQGKVAQTPLDRFNKWSVVHINNGADPESLGATTAQAIVKYAGDIGYAIRMALSVVSVRFESNHDAQLESIFAHEKQNGSQFIMVIANSRIKNHGMIKLLEIKYDIVTEQLTSNVAQKLAHQSNTGTNVVLKVVEKLGGQNHFISKTTSDLPPWLTAKGTMIVGLQMQHPSSLSGKEKENGVLPSRPVMVGWSTNAVRGSTQRGVSDAQLEKEATHFSADWSFATPKDFKDGSAYYADYKEVVLSILRSYKKYREAIPSRILVIRGGVPEGDYDKVRQEEIPIWEAAFKTLNAAYSPSFIFVTANDAHSDRFYQEKIAVNEKAPKQNLPSGTVIDSGVTNPAYAQAFLQSHVPLQGTAKVPSIVVQHLGLNPAHKMVVTMDDVIRTCHALCFAHGVCNTPTAVPTPLYIARESMKRATDLFASYQKRCGSREWNLEEVKKELTINAETSNIHGLRVNA